MNKQEIRARIEEIGIIPAIRVYSAEDALFAAEAVSSGGIPIVEVTITVPGADFLNALRGLGCDYLFADTAIKPLPTCRFTHGPLQVLARLQREHAFAARDVERIEIITFRRSIEVSDRPHVASRSEALLSHQTCAALLLTCGTIDLATLDRGAYREASVRDLAARISVVHSEELEVQYPAAWPHRIGVLTRDGRMLQGFSRNPPGAASDPIPRAVATEWASRNGFNCTGTL